MPPFPTFVGPSYVAQSPFAGVERTVNLYLERTETPDAKFPWALYQIPGVSTFATANEAPGRALFGQDDRAFAVIGFAFYELLANGTLISRGIVASDGKPATISSSGDAGGELFITAGGIGYRYGLATNVLTTVLASGADVGGYSNGYFLSLNTTTSTLRHSAYLDGATWDPSLVALRNAAGDKWVTLQVVDDSGDIWVRGSQTSEIWRHAGTASPAYPFVFAPVQGALVRHGSIARHSGAILAGAPIWLARNTEGAGVIVRGNGYGTPTRVSNHAVEHAIQGYSTMEDAVAFSLQYDGHTFCGFTFPTAEQTWVFDDTTQQWAEWLYWDTSPRGGWRAYKPMFHAYVFGKHVALDRATGTVYELSGNVYTDAGGVELRRMRQVPMPFVGSDWVFPASLELEVQVGVGTATGQGVDPQMMCRLSRDTGKTWGPERWKTLGRMGAYGTIVKWNGLAAMRGNRGVIQTVVTDPVPLRITGAFLEV